ncbi:hypothetical protein ACIB24_00610 [Spongisporangium articulatum]|uniref:ABC-2 type transport system permease protein n=1 Tax=Spongisporangium articulatum TaxID=3362603 RepID=A0ABW8AGU4_9ACTN
MSALGAEWGKLWSVPAPAAALLGAGAVALVTTASLASDFVVDVGRGTVPANAQLPLADALTPAVQTALTLVATFALLPVTAEFASGSIRSTLWAQPRRVRVLNAKAAVVVATVVPAGLLAALTCRAAAVVLLAGHVSGAELRPAAWVLDALRTTVLFAAAALLTLGLAALLRSTAGTLGAAAGLLIAPVLLPDGASRWTPGGAGAQFVAWSGPDPTLCGVVLLGWAAATYAAGRWWFAHRDV